MSNRRLLSTAVAGGACLVLCLAAQSRPARVEPQPDTRAGQTRPTADRATLERAFEESLTGAVLKGTWQMTRRDEKTGETTLTEPRPESYTITSVERDGPEHWIIRARVQFADKDATLPVRVRVVWAGDTPVITLDELTLPLLGTYSARVMIYRELYAGTWFGAGYGGILSGQIVRPDEAATTKPATTAPAGAR